MVTLVSGLAVTATVVLLLLCMVVTVNGDVVTATTSATADGGLSVSVTVVYPQCTIGLQSTLGLRGSYPLSWDESLPLKHTAEDTWTGSFLIASNVLNSTFPVFAIDTKVIINSSIWQLGCNDRFSFTYTPSVSSTAIRTYPYFFQTTGATRVLESIYSPELNNTRDVWLYIPPGAIENDLRMEGNVLVMQDGQNLQPLWNVNTHLDQLIIAGEMTSLFIIGPYNTPDRIAEYTYSVDPQYGGGKGNLYLDFIEKTLLPRVQEEYNVDTQQMNLGIMGSSLGGLISCYAAVTRPAVYSTAGCMSSSFWWNNGDFLSTIVPQLNATVANATQQFYIDSGDSGITDDDITDTSSVVTALIQTGGFELGRNMFWYLQRGGQHNEGYWSERFHHPMQWLYFRTGLNNANGLG